VASSSEDAEISSLDAAALQELARVVLADETLESVLDRLARIAKRIVPGAEEVSMTLIRDDRPFTIVQTGQLALDADELQYARGHGPCMDAGRAGLVFVIDDMVTETRWPDYAQAAVERGVRSSLSVPLPVQDDVIGAVNIYATRPHAFPEPSVTVGRTLASFAAVAVANTHAFSEAAARARQMEDAMATRSTIEQAKGIVMAERRCTPDEAFTILTQASQRSNTKLRDLAAALVASAQEPRPGG
jgi:transcriptional regulator with GAF, ATPase, and Fis domain